MIKVLCTKRLSKKFIELIDYLVIMAKQTVNKISISYQRLINIISEVIFIRLHTQLHLSLSPKYNLLIFLYKNERINKLIKQEQNKT